MVLAAIDPITKGALIALSGAIVAQFGSLFTFFWNHHVEHKKMLWKKCEELSFYLSDFGQWFNSLGKCYSLDDLKNLPANVELSKANSIALLFLPELQTEMNGYSNSVRNLYNFYVDIATDIKFISQTGTMSLGGYANRNNTAESYRLSHELERAKEELIDALQKVARKCR
jgi:hypothetical protein